MSAPLAGKFQDHYAILGIDPKASSDSLQNAYAKLAQKYHPDNPETGDFDKFESINLAYEVLSDPDLRREFNKLKGLDQQTAAKFSGLPFFDDLSRGIDLRVALLCLLCDRRRNRPFTPSLALRQLEMMLETTNEELSFALWYLKQRGYVISDDKSSLQITVEGLDLLESNRPTPERVMELIKPDAVESGTSASEPLVPATKISNAAGSVRNALNSAVARR
jgi:curved DNA-binding protein CbpA